MTNIIEIINYNGAISDHSPTLALHRYGSGGHQFRSATDGTNVLYPENAGSNSVSNPNLMAVTPTSIFKVT